MKKIIFSLFISFLSLVAVAQRVSGTVRDQNGIPLPNASVSIKGKTGGTVCNAEGKFFLNLSKGSYTLYCQHVGYKKETKDVVVDDKDITVDFTLTQVDFTLEEVIIRSGENPANDIIKNTIRMRSFYLKQLNEFVCQVYTKGQLKLRDYPQKVLGQRVVFDDGDTSKNRIIYLSETMSTYSVQKPNNTKIEVHSSKVSGNSDSYGLAAPQFYSLYENTIRIGTTINPRGFISPISENATNYYKYKYVGAFFEDGKQISRIQVTPKRKYEPLFSGYINIVENEWRIHSVNLVLTRTSQMEYLDTLRLEQLYVPYNDSLWVMQNQVIYPTINFMGIVAHGSFVNIYSEFDPDPDFGKKYFNNTVMKYTDSANRKTQTFWDQTRPMELLDEEKMDYQKKDSLERVSKDPAFLDSIDRMRNKFTLPGFLLLGQTFSNEKRRTTYSFKSITELINYNIVEGLVVHAGGIWSKRLDSTIGRRRLSISPNIRYGFTNNHFNAWLSGTYTYGKKYVSSISIAGGKRVFQFNNASPIGIRANTLASLFSSKNLLKLYEAWFASANFTKGIGDGLTVSAGFEYQDRIPLENSTDFTFAKNSKNDFTPNYPTELMSSNFERHQAMNFNVALSWQPGARYIELPDQKINIGSKLPTITVGFTHAVHNLFGSDVDYSKWRFSLNDIVSFKMAGLFNYRIGMGGFLDKEFVQVPDYHHFNGNISHFATEYLNAFQILPIYEFSNTSKFYAVAHVEHHFNGFLTNKIPGFRKLNWYLVGGMNAFHYDKNDYREFFIGLENIFKVLRFDFYFARKDGSKYGSNYRVGFNRNLSRRS